MEPLWNYQDLVKLLGHKQLSVQRWAFERLDKNFASQFTPEVASLLQTPDPYLVTSVLEYLTRFQRKEFTPQILELYHKSTAYLHTSCLIALGKLGDDSAFDSLQQSLSLEDNPHQFDAGLQYLTELGNEQSQHQLLELLQQHWQSPYITEIVRGLVRSLRPQDVAPILSLALKKGITPYIQEQFFEALVGELQVEEHYFMLVMEDQGQTILDNPLAFLEHFQFSTPALKVKVELLEKIADLIRSKNPRDLFLFLSKEAQKCLSERYEDPCPPHLEGIYQRDHFALEMLRVISAKKDWKQIKKKQPHQQRLIALGLSAYFLIHTSWIFDKGLAVDAPLEDLLFSLSCCGSFCPSELNQRLLELAPAEQLKQQLTEQLYSWGDKHILRLMGKIGDPTFLPVFLGIFKEVEELEELLPEAETGLSSLKKAGHPLILEAIQVKKIGLPVPMFNILSHLPYGETFDLVQELSLGKQSQGSLNEDEALVSCLQAIGDSRAIPLLRRLFDPKNPDVVWEALETLADLHQEPLDELEIIRAESAITREEADQVLVMTHEWKLSTHQQGLEGRKEEAEFPDFEQGLEEPIASLPTETTKVGRNDPCPCGSGRKYKKCCAGK